MTDMNELYSGETKASWAGGKYQSVVLDDCRAFDCQIMNKRSNSRDLEITLPRELVGECAPDRALPVLINGDTDPLKQVGAVFANGESVGFVRFSRSEKGKEWQKSFLAGNAHMKLAYSKHGRKKSPCAFAIRAVSDGTRKENDMSEQYTIPKAVIEAEVEKAMARKATDEMKPLPLPYVSEYEQRDFSIMKAINAEIMADWSDAGYEREMIQEERRNYGGAAKGIVIPHSALATRATMVSTGDVSGGIGTELRPDMFVDVVRPVSSVIQAGGRVMNLTGKTAVPTNSNDVSAAFIAENASITESDIDIDTITLEPHMLAGRASYSRQVLATVTPEIEQLVRRNLQLQIANGMDDAALDGSGSGANPQGIANATGIETFATAGSSTMTHAESLDAIAEVGANNHDTSNGVWLVHPTDAATLGAQTKDSGSGQFVYEGGQIAGRRVIETTHAAAGTCYFGLFENVMIGTFGGLDIVVDPYTNGSTGVVNLYAYQMIDIGVLRPNAFQKVTLTA